MVLPASAADEAPDPAERRLIDRLRLILRLGAEGVMVLIDRARPEALGPLVRALFAEEPGLDVHTNALKLAGAAKGSVIVLIPDLAQVKWLNMERPILAERSLRVILFSDEATSTGLARGAPDFFHWISHWMECPPATWRPAVLGIRVAAAAGAAIVWTGGDLDSAFEAALPGQARERFSAAVGYDALVDAIQAAGDGWIEIGDIDGLFRLRRVRWAMAETGRTGRIAVIDPPVKAPGFWPVHGKPMAVRDACRALEEAGAPSAGRLAAILDLEPEAVALAAERLRAGESQAALEGAIATSDDPGAALARHCAEVDALGSEASPPWRRAMGAAGEPASGDADKAEAGLRAGRWVAAAWSALEAGDAEVAVRWARSEAARAEDPVGAARALARALVDRAGATEAAALLRETFEAHEVAARRTPVEHASLLSELGWALHRQGHFAEAREVLEEALHLVREGSGTVDDRIVAGVLLDLGLVLVAQGENRDAREHIEESLRIRSRTGGAEESADTATALGALAHILRVQGDLAGARDHVERALRVAIKVQGDEEHPGIALLLVEMGRILLAQDDLVGARERLERALRILTKVLGDAYHPDIAVSLHELARVLHAQGDLAGARALLERSLQMETRLRGTEDHPAITVMLHELALVFLAQGDLAGARDVLDKVLAIERRLYGTRDHPVPASSEYALARVLLQVGEHETAVELLRHAHAVLCERLGEDHPDARKVAEVLAALSRQGDAP